MNYDLVLGDLNIHVCCPKKPFVRDFFNFTDSFDLHQLVDSPTNNCSHTLDLVLSHDLLIDNMSVDEVPISDILLYP